jgi:hypothetical protein
MLGELIKPFLESAQRGDTLLVATILAVAVVFNLRKITSFLVDRKRVRIKGIEAALQSECVVGPSLECLRELAATEHFYVATGVRLERLPREALIRVHRNSEGRLRFVHFKRALPHVDYKSGRIEIHINAFDRLFMWFGLFAGTPMFIISLALMAPVLFTSLFTDTRLWATLPSLFIFGLAGVCSFMQAMPAYSARLVRKEMTRQASLAHPESAATE